jgi:hypothetical protein
MTNIPAAGYTSERSTVVRSLTIMRPQPDPEAA